MYDQIPQYIKMECNRLNLNYYVQYIASTISRSRHCYEYGGGSASG